MHWEVLNKRQQKLLIQLEVYRKFDAYLAGGTALALHLGHRRSEDFDFYTPIEFNPDSMEMAVTSVLKKFARRQKAYGTLTGECERVGISCFYYNYPLLKPLVETDYIDLASIEDIAAMKIVAISQRGKMRDFLDLYALLKRNSLYEIIRWTNKKYPGLDNYVILKGLTYFADAEGNKSGRGINLFEPIKWGRAKMCIAGEVVKLQRKLL